MPDPEEATDAIPADVAYSGLQLSDSAAYVKSGRPRRGVTPARQVESKRQSPIQLAARSARLVIS